MERERIEVIRLGFSPRLSIMERIRIALNYFCTNNKISILASFTMNIVQIVKRCNRLQFAKERILQYNFRNNGKLTITDLDDQTLAVYKI